MKENETIILDLPPVGVKLLKEGDPKLSEIKPFRGVSYCRAVLRATFGNEVLVKPDSIATCLWAPVVLGFKEPVNSFERAISPRLPAGTAGLYLAPVACFKEEDPPDTVIIRAPEKTLREIIDAAGMEHFVAGDEYHRDATAMGTLFSERRSKIHQGMTRAVNRFLAWMNRFRWWHRFTAFLFRSALVTRIFDRFITAFMANMSLCRNSTVISYLAGKGNVSHFCTGGIAWGRNLPGFMTSGYPWEVYRRFAGRLSFPGTGEGEPGFGDLMETKKKMVNMKTADLGCQK